MFLQRVSPASLGLAKFNTKYVVAVLMLSLIAPSASAYLRNGPTRADLPDQRISRVVVKLKDGPANSSRRAPGLTGVASFDQLNSDLGTSNPVSLIPSKSPAFESESFGNVFVVTVPDNMTASDLVFEYEGLDEVEYAHPDYLAELHQSPNDPLYPHQYSLNNTGQGFYQVLRPDPDSSAELMLYYGTPDADIDAEEVYSNPPDVTFTAVVAILDTGVDHLHPDLAGRIWNNPGEIPDNGLDDDHNGYIDDTRGWDFCAFDDPTIITEDNDPEDYHGHGTHTSGTVAAITNNGLGIAGVIENCRIMPLKFGPLMASSFAAKGVIYAADNGADVISMSFGYSYPVPVLQEALNYARAKGVVLVASSGNDGIEQLNFPASFDGVITVGATNANDEVTSWSTFTPYMEIAAPGLQVLSLRGAGTDMYSNTEDLSIMVIDSFYILASGTSMSCPHVAGAAAWLKAVSPGITPDKVTEILMATADDIVDPYGLGENLVGWDIYSGAGRLNLRAAIEAAPLLHASISLPTPNQIVTGVIDVYGTADGSAFSGYILEYGQGAAPTSWIELANSTAPVDGTVLGNWNTSSLNGTYSLRLRVGENHAGHVTVQLVNRAQAVAQLSYPLEGDTVRSVAILTGSAACADFSHYLLEIGLGTSPAEWDTIAIKTVPVSDDTLAWFNTVDIEEASYTIRLSVFSNTGLEKEQSVAVVIQFPFSADQRWHSALNAKPGFVVNYLDFDNDGLQELVIGTETGLKFFNTDGSLKVTGIGWIPNRDYRIPCAVGDLDGDGLDDLVAVADMWDHGIIHCFLSSEADHEIVTEKPLMIRFRLGNEFTFPTVFLKDIDGDGKDEIHYYPGWDTGQRECRYLIYDGTGSLLLELPVSVDYYAYLPADLDGDGICEIYTAFDSLEQRDLAGNVVNSINLQLDSLLGFTPVHLSAVDVDYDGKNELILIGRLGCISIYEPPGATTYIYAFDEGLVEVPGWNHEPGLECFIASSHPPLFADIEGNSDLEYIMSATEYSHGLLFANHMDGSFVGDPSNFGVIGRTAFRGSLSCPVVADITGDNRPDIVALAGPDVLKTYMYERLVAWNTDGEILDGWPLTTASLVDSPDVYLSGSTPTVGDFDNDGNVDIVATTRWNEIVSLSLPGIPYNKTYSPVPIWRYNRRLNSTMEPFVRYCGAYTEGYTGNTDCSIDGKRNLADITRLIDHVYISKAHLCWRENGNTDGDPEAKVNLADITRLIDHVYISKAETAACE